MAPPLGFTLAMSGPSSWAQASTTEAKASLISTTSTSSIPIPAWARRLRLAGPGRPQLRLQPERVGVGPRDAVLLGHALGPFELAGELVVGEVRAGDRLPVPGLGPGAGVGPDRHLAHVLDAAGEHHVLGARPDE